LVVIFLFVAIAKSQFSDCDYVGVVLECQEASLTYASCVFENVDLTVPLDTSNTTAYLDNMQLYLSQICGCVRPYFYCWIHSGACPEIGSLLNDYFDANCYGSCFTSVVTPHSGAVCSLDYGRWTYAGSITVTGSVSFDATTTIEIDGDFTVSADSTLTVSPFGYVYAATVVINGAVVVHVESQIGLDFLPYVHVSTKRQDSKQKEIVIATGADVSVSDLKNFEITFDTKACATFDSFMRKNLTHVVLVLDNYDDSSCSGDYDEYVQGEATSSSSSASAQTTKDDTNNAVSIVASFF
jgi:hypothetical protein